MSEVKLKTLKNGIRVYFYKSSMLKHTFVSYNVEYGSSGYYDKFYYKDKPYHVKPAMAHFLEHLLIEKSHLGNMHINFNSRNYESNGLTYSDLTSFYFIGYDTKENILTSIKELILMVDKPNFTYENVEEVKNAIIEELNIKEDNKYQLALANNRHNTFVSFDEVPVNNNVLGSVKTTKEITLEDVKTCYDAYYYDENKFLVIGGDVDIPEVCLRIALGGRTPPEAIFRIVVERLMVAHRAADRHAVPAEVVGVLIVG